MMAVISISAEELSHVEGMMNYCPEIARTRNKSGNVVKLLKRVRQRMRTHLFVAIIGPELVDVEAENVAREWTR